MKQVCGCRVCNFYLPLDEWIKHIFGKHLIGAASSYLSCSECEIPLNGLIECITHFMERHSITIYKCDECEFSFTELNKFRIHSCGFCSLCGLPQCECADEDETNEYREWRDNWYRENCEL